ncbi:hypothetical protein VW35_19420 [Devosia soli]|uniref:Glycosyltransferase subfamily 4-like N-terminal domain-containing protein n=1 Tax=Devosia soli TaxID=361041 RepID=A0A0F5L163_9HYPH|nr:WcaI family glycosyltransferase [Devosia soli]KKB76088.1 hypothetical protein VW35_19420 [Devosia soli]
MRILLLGLNYAPEPIGTARYTTGLVDALASRGHEVRVVAGQPYYPNWSSRPGYRGWTKETRGTAEILRVPHVIPQKPTGRGRLIQHLTFALAALPHMLASAISWRPDCVIAIAPSLLAAPLVLMTAQLSGARSWLHVQDFELEAAMATGLVSRRPLIAKILGTIEKRLLQSFDRVSSISPAMCRRLLSKGVAAERISEHRNWAELAAIRAGQERSSYRDLWQIETPHVALYSGAMGRKQGLDLIVEAARRLKGRRDLTFVVCGNGPYRGELEALARVLDNIRFQDLQPTERLGDLLSLATVHVLPQIAGAADLVLPSKLPNMLPSGRPVIATAAIGTGLFDEIAGCGIAVPPGDAEALAKAIGELCDDPLLAQKLGAAGRCRAEARWDGPTILAGFAADIEVAVSAQQKLVALVGEPL